MEPTKNNYISIFNELWRKKDITKVDFCLKIDVSRETFDKYLDGIDILPSKKRQIEDGIRALIKEDQEEVIKLPFHKLQESGEMKRASEFMTQVSTILQSSYAESFLLAVRHFHEDALREMKEKERRHPQAWG